MRGCNWQEKSFSVAASDTDTDYACADCKKKISGVYKYNGDVFCKECFGKKSVKRSSIGMFSTHKDLAYNFTTEMFGGKSIAINSRRQFKALLKQYKLADASMKECRQEAEFRRRINTEDTILERRKNAENIFLRNKERLRFRRQR